MDLANLLPNPSDLPASSSSVQSLSGPFFRQPFRLEFGFGFRCGLRRGRGFRFHTTTLRRLGGSDDASGVSIVYFAALIVGLGTLLVQVAFGARGGGHHGFGGGGAHHLGDAGGGGHGHEAEHASKAAASAAGFFVVFLSFRFWIFAALGFGLGGSILRLTGALPASVEAIVAGVLGLGSGLGAALALRAATSSSVGTPNEASRAVGGVARVVVPIGKGAEGKVRIEIGGSSIDLIASSDDDDLAKDEMVLVEEVAGGIAKVSRRPRELE